MRLNFLAFLLCATIFYGINGEINVDECNIQEFFNVTKTQKLVKLENDYYKFVDGTDIYVNEDYLTFWLKLEDSPVNFEILSIWKLRPAVKIFFEPYGKEACLSSFDINDSVLNDSKSIDLSKCSCQPFVQNNKNFVPFKVWTENGPLRIQVRQNHLLLNVYIFEEMVEKMNAAKCLNEKFLLRNYARLDYTDLLTIQKNDIGFMEEMPFFNVNGNSYINLKNSITVVWLKIKESAPEHFVFIETETNEIMQKTFEIGLEINGRNFENEKIEFLSNGLKINLKSEYCIPNYYFLGFTRYIITVNETGVLKASFYDSKSGKSLKIYFLKEEANGKPKFISNKKNLKKIVTSLIPKNSLTNFKATLKSSPISAANIIPEKRYITTFTSRGRFGNIIYRCASLYGIGKSLNRIPYISAVKDMVELSEVFPLMSDYIELKFPSKNSEKVVNYAPDENKYEPPSNLNIYNASKYLKISGIYMQSFKFFEEYKSDIKKLLECNPILKEKVKVEAANMWTNDSSSHKFCVHIRRGDFQEYRTFLETREDFLLPAIKHINFQIKAKTKQNSSLLIFGDDINFIKNLELENNTFTSINTFENVENGSKGFEMCFAIEFCDTLLLSSSSSTFGWWIGYLLKSQGTVYYNSEIAKYKAYTKYKNSADVFPPNWIQLNVSYISVVKEI